MAQGEAFKAIECHATCPIRHPQAWQGFFHPGRPQINTRRWPEIALGIIFGLVLQTLTSHSFLRTIQGCANREQAEPQSRKAPLPLPPKKNNSSSPASARTGAAPGVQTESAEHAAMQQNERYSEPQIDLCAQDLYRLQWILQNAPEVVQGDVCARFCPPATGRNPHSRHFGHVPLAALKC